MNSPIDTRDDNDAVAVEPARAWTCPTLVFYLAEDAENGLNDGSDGLAVS